MTTLLTHSLSPPAHIRLFLTSTSSTLDLHLVQLPLDPVKMNTLPEKTSTECSNCSFKDQWLLHHVRLREEYRRLCTSCVLKLHLSSFCPICFNLFDPSAPHRDRMTCQKCTSIAHSRCVSKPYTCQTCIRPGFRYFDVNRNAGNMFQIDINAAKALLCAARIASESMARAVHISESEVTRRVKETVASKKRAKEALEDICGREKARKLGKNGVRTSNVDRAVVGSSGSIHGGPSNFTSQSRLSNTGMVLGPGGTGNSHITMGDDLRGESSIGDTGKISPDILANPMNVDTAGNTINVNGRLASWPSGLAEDGEC